MDDAVCLAVAQANKSVETFRHGAVVLRGRSVVAVGRNKNSNACGLSSVHAEMDALWRLRNKKRKNVHIVVVRLRRDQDLGFSRPCPSCLRMLERWGVTRMTYSTGDTSKPFVTEALG
jgi:tRNA(Arg) A34 adenosine deaminase TadA